MHWTDHINVQMLIELKEMSTKMYFHMPQNFWPPFTLLSHNIQTFFCGPEFSPPRYPDNKFQIFPFTLYPSPGVQYKGFELKLNTDIQKDVHTQITAFRHPSQSYLPPTPRTVQK